MDLADMLESHGLSGKQYDVLRRGGESGLPVSRISEQMTDPSTVEITVEELDE